jgi:hypothetical protein
MLRELNVVEQRYRAVLERSIPYASAGLQQAPYRDRESCPLVVIRGHCGLSAQAEDHSASGLRRAG